MKVRLSLVATFSREILYMYYIPINHPGSENTNGGLLTGEYPSNVEASANVQFYTDNAVVIWITIIFRIAFILNV